MGTISFDYPVFMRVLRYLHRYSDDGVYESQIAKELDITYSHIVKTINLLRDDGLLSFRINGRIKFIALTSKGRIDAKLIDDYLTHRNVEIKRGVR